MRNLFVNTVSVLSYIQLHIGNANLRARYIWSLYYLQSPINIKPEYIYPESQEWRNVNLITVTSLWVAMASQITGVSSDYSTDSSAADQRKHQSSALLAFVTGIHRWPVKSPAQRASNANNVCILLRHHYTSFCVNRPIQSRLYLAFNSSMSISWAFIWYGYDFLATNIYQINCVWCESPYHVIYSQIK